MSNGDRVARTARAEADLIEIGRYIAQDNPGAAKRLLARFDALTTLLAGQPGLGRSHDAVLRPGFRRFVVGNYLILYRETDQGIEVVRYVHGRRDLRDIL